MYERNYAFTRQVDGTVDEVAGRVREALAAEGFGVLTEINLAATLKKKLDVERPPYLILGACKPPLANKAVQAETPIGVLLPCNVTVFEGEDGKTYVQAIKPEAMFSMVDNPDVAPVADQVGEELQRALDAV